MSIITSVEVTPSRLRSIYKWLLQCKEYEEDEEKLKQYLIPSTYSKDKDRRTTFVNPNLLEGESMELFERNDGRVKLSQKVVNSGATFNEVVSNLVFNPENNRNEDFCLTVSWILAVGPFSQPQGWRWQEFEFSYKKTPLPLQQKCGINDLRYGNLILWSTFLGCSWNHSQFVPDPTQNISWQLQEFDKNKEIPVMEFLELLSSKLPVIDKGFYRKEVQDFFDEELQETTLSASLSLALNRLREKGSLTLIMKSDTIQYKLSKEFNSEFFSHVIIS